jgi:glutamine phosphoribosylpyrophosphate amidotransferase
MMQELTLSDSLVIMTSSSVYAVRDPWGNRPLALGVIDGESGWPLYFQKVCALTHRRTCLLRRIGNVRFRGSGSILSRRVAGRDRQGSCLPCSICT